MHLRTPRRLTLIALVAPALAVLPATTPASAVPATQSSSTVVTREASTFGQPLPADHLYRQVAVGYSMSYGLTADGTIEAAGYFDETLAPPTAPAGTSWVAIAAGDSHGLALDSDGHVATWGVASDDRSVPATVPTDVAAETLRQVSAGRHHDLGVTVDGRVVGWGNPSHLGELNIPAQLTTDDPADPVVQVSTAYGVSAALTESGRLVAWGGLLNTMPAGLADETVVEISAGSGHLLVRAEDGNLYDWGYYAAEAAPASLADETVTQIESVFQSTSAALTADGEVVVWGTGERTVPPGRADAQAVGIDLGRYRGAIVYGALSSVEAPVISGTPRYDEPLTATAGEWSDEPDEVHYEWTLHAYGTTRTVGTDSATYSPTAQDALDWGTLTVTVTAEKDGFESGTATSSETDHIAQQMFTAAPAVTVAGSPRVGQVLTATTTPATPAPDSTEVMWFRSPVDETDEFPERIDSATGATLTLTPDLLGAQVFVNVTSYKEGYEPAFDETEPVTIAAGSLAAPTVTVTGTPRVGQTLTVSATGATPSPDTTRYAWYVRTGPGALSPLDGATTATLTLTPDLAGKTVLARATATKLGYTAVTADSGALLVAPDSLGSPTITVTGSPRVGQTLTATTVAAPQATSTSYQWLRGSTPITGATAATYRVTAADLGLALRVQVTTGAAGHDDATATSVATAPVTLGAATLAITAPKKVAAGKAVTIKVRHLAAREKVVVTIGGAKVTGRANAAGIATVKVKVTGKPGKRAVRAVGSLPDRAGRAVVRVVPPRRR